MLNHGVNCDDAMQMSLRYAQQIAYSFTETEECELEAQDDSSPVLQVFIKACKDVAMGLVHWRYVHLIRLLIHVDLFHIAMLDRDISKRKNWASTKSLIFRYRKLITSSDSGYHFISVILLA